ncbi:type I restriction enzyme endonuclease domain-containing protein [Spiroplasma endosymbiont of Polydrusus pterygomalis]|uniref:type I restriction enzyme endonuclease domain-containing protein n=1 Tax=Spiroplasma endosymbiont of Polydrusus pterygomalis TaxID=3139327 RepID=UPI003CCABC81
MLLTGFDVPCLDVMYIDKPLRMHNLMQAIARVNRTFQEGQLIKNYGLIVDFIGLGKYLNEAIATYTTIVKNHPTIEYINIVIERLKNQYEALCNMFHKFNFTNFTKSNSSEKYVIIKNAYEFILEEDIKNNPTEKILLNRFMKQTKLLEEGYKYAINQLEPDLKIKLSFFIALRGFINKNLYNQAIVPAINFKNALKDILESAIVSKQLITITDLDNENKIDILDQKSIEKLKTDYPPRTLIEMMTNWLQKEIKLLATKNIIKSEIFQEKLAAIIDSYNKVSDPEAMLHTIIQLAKEINSSKTSNINLGLSPEEEAFYDALCRPQNITREYDKKILITMAKELLANVKINATVDWYKKKDAKSKMLVEIKKLLYKYKYPPEYYKNATKGIIEQAVRYANTKW